MKKTPWRRLVLGMLGAVSLTLGVVFSDLIVEDTVVLLPDADRFFATPLTGDSLEDDPGAMLGPLLVTAPDPLFEDASVVHPTIYDDQGSSHTVEQSPASGNIDSTGSDGSGRAGPQEGTQGGDDSPAVGSGGDAVQGGALVAIVRFIDLCAETPGSGCPLGLGATVLFGSDPPLPPPLRVEIIPEATTALFPTLRCGPMWPTPNVIPVVLFSNRPYDTLHVTLKDSDGYVLSQALNGRSMPVEFALYDQRLHGWQGTEATEKAGVHTCLEMPIDALVATPPDRGGPFVLTVDAFHGSEHWGNTVTFAGYETGPRPPTRILPIDQNRGYVVVAQQLGDATAVWVYEESESGRQSENGPIGCASPPSQTDSRAIRVNPSAVPKSFPEADLTSAAWPWDRSFSQYTVWMLDLKHSADYTLCVDLAQEGWNEEWVLQTPNGLVLEVDAGPLQYNVDVAKASLRVNILGVDGCFAATPMVVFGGEPFPFPHEHLEGNGAYLDHYPSMCDSANGFVGAEIELRAGIQNDESGDYGILKIPTQVLLTQCGPGFSVEGPPCDGSLEWRQRTLCGGFGVASCKGDVHYSLAVSFVAFVDTSNGRPDPRDWGISRLARLGETVDTVPVP